jgi:hypothetical protein
MSQVDVIVTGWEATEPFTALQTIASPVAALGDPTLQVGAVIPLAAELSAPADGSAARRRQRLEPRPAAVAGAVERGEAYSPERWARPSPSPVRRGDAVLLTRVESRVRHRLVGHSLAHAYAQGRGRRSRWRRQPPAVTLESDALATARRRPA